jgi:outer membrane protein OmpA-like peptidoglycan-associated protein
MRRLFVLILLAPLLLGGCVLFGPPPHYVVYFEEWSAELDGPARGTIAEAAKWARGHPAHRVLVRGYADPVGTPMANRGISAKRARAVSDRLVADGVSPASIHNAALGETPFALDSQESRRVEIVLGTN